MFIYIIMDIITPRVEGLKLYDEPSVKVKSIEWELDAPTGIQEELVSNLGYVPFIWYQAYQIEAEDLRRFRLDYNSLIPKLSFTFFDSLNFISDKGFPGDNVTIQVFLNSRNPRLRSIFQEFIITKFMKNDKMGVFTIEAQLNIKGLYKQGQKSYRGTSWQVLRNWARENELGWASNINDTTDEMVWINPGLSTKDWINEHVMKHAYLSDQAFLWAYIDPYYRLCYMDLETSLRQDVSEAVGIDDGGNAELNRAVGTKESEKAELTRLFLTNDDSMRNSDKYFNWYKINNQSSEISLRKGYSVNIKTYSLKDKRNEVFKITSLNDTGDDKILLKDNPNSSNWFEEHTVWETKDIYDSDNVHLNYHYASTQNNVNIAEISKLSIKLSLPTPNFNLARFQKIYIAISNQLITPSARMINQRLSGEWLITSISYVLTGGAFAQELTLVKRELENKN